MNGIGQADQPLAAEPSYRKAQRAVLALCMLLAPLTLSAWFGLCPPFGDVSCPSQGATALNAFQTMTPQVLQVFLALSVLAPYAYPVSYIGLGLLQVIGYALVFAGSVPAAIAMMNYRRPHRAPAIH